MEGHRAAFEISHPLTCGRTEMRSKKVCGEAISLSLAGALSFAAGNSVGQDVTPPEESSSEESPQEGTREPPTVSVTVTVGARAVDAAPQTITVIDRSHIEASGARTLGDVLRSASGLHVVDNGSRAMTTVSIRGGDPNFTMVLLDGVPLNDSTDQLGGIVNLESLAAESIERIEIARGPLSFYYGSAALAGVVNVITRKGNPERRQLALDLRAGAGDLIYGSGAWSGGSDRTDYAVVAGFERERHLVAFERFQKAHFGGKLGWSFSESANLQLSGRVAGWEADDYPEASGGPIFGSGELRASDRSELSVAGSLQLGRPGGFKHHVHGSFYDSRLERSTPEISSAVPPIDETTTYRRARTGWSATILSTGRAELNGGVDLDHERGENTSQLILPQAFGGAVPGDYTISRTTPGAFAELILGLGGVVLEGGTRVDVPDGPGGTVWSPRFGVSARPGAGGIRVRGSFAKGFKLPSFFALSSPRALGGNPLLTPERSTGIDVGVEHTFAAWHTEADVTVFYNRFDDLVDFDFDSFQHVNRESVSSRGAEFRVTWTPHSNLSISSEMTWNKVLDRDTSEPLLHRPEWFGLLRVEWRPIRPVNLWAHVRAVGRSLDRQLTVPDRDDVEGYGLLGFSASWRIASAWKVHGSVDNVTDTQYENFIGFPGAGITAQVGLRYTGGEGP